MQQRNNHKLRVEELKLIDNEKHMYERTFLEAAHKAFKNNIITIKTN